MREAALYAGRTVPSRHAFERAVAKRAQGVRSLAVSCELCHHQAIVNVDRFGDTVVVPAFGPRMVCTGCGIIGGRKKLAPLAQGQVVEEERESR
jgi:hypothetical protein